MAIEDLRPPSPAEREAISKQNQEKITERANRYHRVFVQNHDGARILEELVQSYVFSGFTPNDASTTELAKAEARREFVAMIVSMINRSE